MSKLPDRESWPLRLGLARSLAYSEEFLSFMPPIHGRFPKSAHLRKSGEFAQLRDEGKSFHGKLFVLSVLALSSVGEDARELGEAKIGLITSRRVGGAVVRNRVRRRLREIVREALPHLKRGIWVALIARKSASEASYEAIRSEWVYLAKRGAILC